MGWGPDFILSVIQQTVPEPRYGSTVDTIGACPHGAWSVVTFPWLVALVYTSHVCINQSPVVRGWVSIIVSIHSPVYLLDAPPILSGLLGTLVTMQSPRKFTEGRRRTSLGGSRRETSVLFARPHSCRSWEPQKESSQQS